MKFELTYHTDKESFKRWYNIAEETIEELKPKVLKTLNTKGEIVFAENSSGLFPLPVESINSVTIKMT